MNKSHTDYMHLFVLVAFAVAQPIYDLLGKNPEFFVAHSANPALIFTMILVLSFGLALFPIFCELAVRLIGERVRLCVHWFFVFVLVFAIDPNVDETNDCVRFFYHFFRSAFRAPLYDIICALKDGSLCS